MSARLSSRVQDYWRDRVRRLIENAGLTITSMTVDVLDDAPAPRVARPRPPAATMPLFDLDEDVS